MTKDHINPTHYKGTLVIPADRVKDFVMEDGSISLEYMDVCEFVMTKEEFQGHLKGQVLKYLFRSGKKDAVPQELKKANWYMTRFANWAQRIFG